MTTKLHCALSGVSLDDGDPLHRGRYRIVDGRELLVCAAVANVLDAPKARRHDLERFVRTLREREARS